MTTVKACINTVMVLTGWKKSGAFKVRRICVLGSLSPHPDHVFKSLNVIQVSYEKNRKKSNYSMRLRTGYVAEHVKRAFDSAPEAAGDP